MTVTDTHVATLHAMLTGDEDEYERGVAEQDRTGEYEGWGNLLLWAFHDVVLRRFSPTWRPVDVTGFVAHLRSRWTKSRVELDPNVAERLIRAQLGEGTPPPMNPDSMYTLIVVLTQLIDDEEHDEDGIANVVAQARERANAEAD